MNVLQLVRNIPQLQWDRQRNLRGLTSFSIGGPAELLVYANSIRALMQLNKKANQEDIPITILGGGTNVLISDIGIAGITLKLGKAFDYTKILSKRNGCVEIEVGMATSLPAFHRWAWKEHVGGTSCLAGIPGTIGGAVAVNAGTRTQAIGSFVERVGFITSTGELVEATAESLNFAYRYAWMPENWIAVYAILCLTPSVTKEERKERDKLLEHRLATQPHGAKCAGSFFKNPDPVNGPFAGELLDQAGLRGTRLGGAIISKVHANFLVNQGWATADDILRLAITAHKRVKAKFGVSLKPEVRFMGKKLQWSES